MSKHFIHSHTSRAMAYIATPDASPVSSPVSSPVHQTKPKVLESQKEVSKLPDPIKLSEVNKLILEREKLYQTQQERLTLEREALGAQQRQAIIEDTRIKLEKEKLAKQFQLLELEKSRIEAEKRAIELDRKKNDTTGEAPSITKINDVIAILSVEDSSGTPSGTPQATTKKIEVLPQTDTSTDSLEVETLGGSSEGETEYEIV